MGFGLTFPSREGKQKRLSPNPFGDSLFQFRKCIFWQRANFVNQSVAVDKANLRKNGGRLAPANFSERGIAPTLFASRRKWHHRACIGFEFL